MAPSSRFSSTKLALALSSVGAFALACSNGETPDGGGGGVDAADAEDSGGVDADAGAMDARDARPRDADPPDLGPPDLGSCGCSYGFQQQCAEDESCGLGFSGEATCMRVEPFGGTAFGACSMAVTATAAMGAACTAQCVPATRGSPCGDAPRGAVEDYIQRWWQAVSYASQMLPGPGPNAMRDQDISNAGGGSPDACNAFIKWTVLAAASLCRGEGAVIPPDVGYFDQINMWRFRHIEPDDECQIAAEAWCARALELGVQTGTVAATGVDAIPPSCPVLPYGPPCQGADAQTCLRNRMATMIHLINTPPPD